MHSLLLYGLLVPEGDAMMTRWPGAGARVVPEGDALASSLGFHGLKCYCDHGEVWDVPEGDALAITLGFNGLKWYCDHLGFGRFPKGMHSLLL